MVKNRIKKIIFLTLTIFSTIPTVQAGAGKSFGFFAGGALAGGLIGSALAKRNKNSNQQTVIQERVIERQPVYVQQPPQQQTIVTNWQKAQLKTQVTQQQQEIMDLRRQLKAEHKAAEKRTQKIKKIRPTTKKGLSEDIFDGFDPQVEEEEE